MRIANMAAVAAASALLGACGGSGSDSSTTPAGPTTYAQGTPVTGASDTFATVKVDDSNNTINGTYLQRVASVNTDGSYSLTQVDPTDTTLVVNGVTYHFEPATLDFDGKGHETSAAYSLANGTTQTCSFTLQSGDQALPWYIGETYSKTIVETCNPGTAVTFVITGSVVSAESVTVPAGTFDAVKTQSTETYTDSNGQQVVETITHWADPGHSLFTLKTVITYARSGTVPPHHLVSQTIELQSRGN